MTGGQDPSYDRLVAKPSPPLRGKVAAPGDKSISHRALILGALAEGETRIDGLLEAQDVLRTAEALRLFGADVHRLASGEWCVKGCDWKSPSQPIDCGNSGTAARLLMGAAAGFPIKVTFIGDESLGRRPMERVLDPLRQMGAKASGDHLPVTVKGGHLKGIHYLNEHASAQVKSAILFAGLRAAGEVEIIEPLRTRDHSENLLRAFGCDIDTDGQHIRLINRKSLRATEVNIPGDPSSAAFPLVAALIMTGSEVTVEGVMMNPLRTGLFRTLEEMGAMLTYSNRKILTGEMAADVTARFSRLHGVAVPAERAPSMIDEYPILAVAAAFAKGQTVMHGLAELRVKESDRLSAILEGLRACGITAQVEGDTLIVEGTAHVGGGVSISAMRDHRIAMSFLILGLAASRPVTVDSAHMIGTSFPNFTALMHSLGARIDTGI